MNIVPLVVNGNTVASSSRLSFQLLHPSSQQRLTRVPLCTEDEVEQVVRSASNAFPSWRDIPLQQRIRFMNRWYNLLRSSQSKLVDAIMSETGMTRIVAENDILRGLEMMEFAMGISTLFLGESADNISIGVDCRTVRRPVGVVLGITPFCLPAMAPLWIVPVAITVGNTVIIKPSERAPGVAVLLAQLAVEAGIPSGVFNIIHGVKETVEMLLRREEIEVVTFFGSTTVGRAIWDNASLRRKRVQCYLSRKDIAIVLPDASKTETIDAIMASAFGTSGQSCFSLRTVVFVGEGVMAEWMPLLQEQCDMLEVGDGADPATDISALASFETAGTAKAIVAEAILDGAESLLDGRDVQVPRFPNGNWFGPTLLSKVTPSMRVFQEECLAPILCCMEKPTLEMAIDFVNSVESCSAVSVFTSSGAAARRVQQRCVAGQIGVNVPVAVALPTFSWTSDGSAAQQGMGSIGGRGCVELYTRSQVTVSRWSYSPNTFGTKK